MNGHVTLIHVQIDTFSAVMGFPAKDDRDGSLMHFNRNNQDGNISYNETQDDSINTRTHVMMQPNKRIRTYAAETGNYGHGPERTKDEWDVLGWQKE